MNPIAILLFAWQRARVAIVICLQFSLGSLVAVAVADQGIPDPETSADAFAESTFLAKGDSPVEDSPLAALEQLLQSPVEVPSLTQEVTTVSGQQSTVGRSPAAVFVITPEMIRHSGATCIPELLRMVPGVQVARINSHEWAITARGFNSDIAGLFAANNKLLVLIDGRTVYTPFFSGTYWDVQDVPLNDIERIEVIRGPGATIWGANAMNGVVNVITKSAMDTQGGLAKVGGGTEERRFATGRIGGRIGDNAYYRVYGKGFDRDASFHPWHRGDDQWQQGRGGMRVDWMPSDYDQLTLQGDMYRGEDGFYDPATNLADESEVLGGNLLARWTRTLSDDSDVSLQLYYDRADRSNNFGVIDQEFTTYDIDFRHHVRFGGIHNLVWGLGYRSVHDRLNSLTSPPAAVVSFAPTQRTYNTFSTFVQDEIAIADDLWLTLGAKLQHNDFTNWELQPSVRLLYSPEQSWAAWAAISRAVRTPSRIEHDGTIGDGTPFLQFSRAFDSESMIAYELGYRSQPEPWFAWDFAVFFNQYDQLTSLRLTPPGVLPVFNANGNTGEGYGAELSGHVEITPCWRVSGNYAFLQLQIHPDSQGISFLGTDGPLIEGTSPHNQLYLMSTHNLSHCVELDLIGRYVDSLPVASIPSYVELDVRLGWHTGPCTEIAVVGQNLLDEHHPEYLGGYEIERGVYGMITHQW